MAARVSADRNTERQVAEYPSIVTIAAVFVFGSVIGSFLNTVVHRLPAMTTGDREGRYDLIHPRSRCPGCSHPI
ncbi:MAG: prepilin peptidase, partial [Rhodospirillales bacterium]